MDLLEEDFSKFEFVMSGLDYIVDQQNQYQIHRSGNWIFNWIDCRKTDESKKFYGWINDKVKNEFGSKNSRNILSPPILSKDSLQFSINLSDANHSGLENQSIFIDANLSVSADIVDDSSVLIASVPASMKNLCFSGQSDFNFSNSSELPNDSQITLLLKTPVDVLAASNAGIANYQNPFLDAVNGVRELASSVSFRDDSIFFKTIVLCKDTQRRQQ